jgi:hypothetical protein
MQLRVDLHVHTVDSKDAHTRHEWIPQIMSAKHLNALAITEHDVFEPKRYEGVTVIPGIEVSSSDGHVIGLGVSEIIRSGLSADETIDQIHAQGALVVIPHPHDPVSSRVRVRGLNSRPDAVEVVNADALSYRYNRWLSGKDAMSMGLPMVGGSDSHVPATIGDGFTLVDCDGSTVDQILRAIRRGNVVPMGSATSFADKISKYYDALWKRRMSQSLTI